MTDIDALVSILREKHLVLCGGLRENRLALASNVLQAMADADTKRYDFPENIGSSDEYLRQAQNLFPIQSPLGIDKTAMNLNQVSDMLLDWTEGEQGTILIYLPEAGFSDDFAPVGVLNDYVTQKFMYEDASLPLSNGATHFRLLATTPFNLMEIHQHIELYIGRAHDDTRPLEQIAREHLAIILLDTIDPITTTVM